MDPENKPSPHPLYPAKAVARFLRRVGEPDPVTGCRLWKGRLTANGYAQTTHDKVTRYAHRVAWELAHGKRIPDGMVVDHLCRVRHCQAAEHLEVVTTEENTRRGLAVGCQWTRGERNGRSKLTYEAVQVIRSARLSYEALASQFGVSRKQIKNVIERKSWAWVP